jgi:hypothetical protein
MTNIIVYSLLLPGYKKNYIVFRHSYWFLFLNLKLTKCVYRNMLINLNYYEYIRQKSSKVWPTYCLVSRCLKSEDGKYCMLLAASQLSLRAHVSCLFSESCILQSRIMKYC